MNPIEFYAADVSSFPTDMVFLHFLLSAMSFFALIVYDTIESQLILSSSSFTRFPFSAFLFASSQDLFLASSFPSLGLLAVSPIKFLSPPAVCFFLLGFTFTPRRFPTLALFF